MYFLNLLPIEFKKKIYLYTAKFFTRLIYKYKFLQIPWFLIYILYLSHHYANTMW